MANFRKPLNTQELVSYAINNKIEVASTTALSNCGVLRPPGQEPAPAAESAGLDEVAGVKEPEPTPARALKKTVKPTMILSVDRVSGERPRKLNDVLGNQKKPPRKPAKTMLEISNAPQEKTAGFHYFSGAAEGRTYTAELRFRDQFAADNRPDVTGDAMESAGIETADQQWNSLGDFSPPPMDFSPEAFDTNTDESSSSTMSMLDIIDEGYQPLNPTPRGYLSRPAEVMVNYGENETSLSSRPGGLMGGGLGESIRQAISGKKWAKRSDQS
ncbi:MAG: hypothetical protein IPM23_20990 [Candidatus Melainabacteria bacterium]|nr:hypothetical protein [Candidatus Melainabacteria bacterium]